MARAANRFWWLWLAIAALLMAAVIGAVLQLTSPGALPVRQVRVEEHPVAAPTPYSSHLDPALTHDASEIRRVASEHASLLTSLPPTPVPTPELESGPDASPVASIGRGAGDGSPAAESPESWFDGSVAIDDTFYRAEPGDWTDPAVREVNPHAPMFYFDGYPPGVPNFADGSIKRLIASRLAMEASRSLDFLGEPTPALVGELAGALGWQIRDASVPVANVWSTLRFTRSGSVHTYGVAAVMVFDVLDRDLSAAESTALAERLGLAERPRQLQYLLPAHFAGPVVVERVLLSRS